MAGDGARGVGRAAGSVAPSDPAGDGGVLIGWDDAGVILACDGGVILREAAGVCRCIGGAGVRRAAPGTKGPGWDVRSPNAADIASAGVWRPCADSTPTGITPPQVEHRARTPPSGTLAGSTRKTVEHCGQLTFITGLHSL